MDAISIFLNHLFDQIKSNKSDDNYSLNILLLSMENFFFENNSSSYEAGLTVLERSMEADAVNFMQILDFGFQESLIRLHGITKDIRLLNFCELILNDFYRKEHKVLLSLPFNGKLLNSFLLIPIKLYLLKFERTRYLMSSVNHDVGFFLRNCFFLKKGISLSPDVFSEEMSNDYSAVIVNCKKIFLLLNSTFKNEVFYNIAANLRLTEEGLNFGDFRKKIPRFESRIWNTLQFEMQKDHIDKKGRYLRKKSRQIFQEDISGNMQSGPISHYLDALVYFQMYILRKDSKDYNSGLQSLIKFLDKRDKEDFVVSGDLIKMFRLVLNREDQLSVPIDPDVVNKIEVKNYTNLNSSIDSVVIKILFSAFPRTMIILNEMAPCKLKDWSKSNDLSNQTYINFFLFVKHELKVNPSSSLRSFFHLEMSRFKLLQKLYVKKDLYQLHSDLVITSGLKFLMLNPTLKLYKIIIHPSIKVYDFTFNLKLHKEERIVIGLIYNRLTRLLEERTINPLMRIIIKVYQGNPKSEEVINLVLKYIDYESVDYEQCEALIISTVNNMVSKQMLIYESC